MILVSLTLMLLVANFVIANDEKYPVNDWHMGTHQKVLSESYLMNPKMTGFRCFSKTLASLCFGKK